MASTTQPTVPVISCGVYNTKKGPLVGHEGARVKLSRHQAIRDVLLAAEDGMTLKEIAGKLNVDIEAIRASIRNVWGVYIDRWTHATRGQHSAVYMCVAVPENAPKPRRKK